MTVRLLRSGNISSQFSVQFLSAQYVYINIYIISKIFTVSFRVLITLQ